MSANEEPDAAIDELYALAPGEFVGARNALARRMKADGRRDDAAAVAKLRRPSVVAWAINQAVRTDPDRVAELVDAADRQATAQQDLLDGGDAEALRSATHDRRVAARAVVDAAVALAGPTHADAIRTTLDAAIADPGLVERLRAGTLADTLDAPAGFGFGFPTGTDGSETAPTRRANRPRSPSRAKADVPSGTDEAERARAEAADVARREAEAMVAGLERELARAEKWADRAARSVEAAADEAATAAEALAAAQERAAEAGAEERRASRELTEREAERARQADLLERARAMLADLDDER